MTRTQLNTNWKQPFVINYTSDGEEIIDPTQRPLHNTFTVTDFNSMISGPSSQDMGRITRSTFIGGPPEAYKQMVNDGNRVYFVNSAEEYEFEKVIKDKGAISIASLLQYGALSVLKLHKRGFTIANDDRSHGEATPISVMQREQNNAEINYIQPQNISWGTTTDSALKTYISNGLSYEQ